MVFNWRKFPWTNLHDLNLDWIIQTVKTLEENLAANVGYVNTVDSKLNTEISNRKAGDAAIQTAIEHEIKPELATETENRKSGDAAIQTALATETENRKSGDAAIQTAIEHEIKPKLVRDFHVTGSASQDGYITAVTFKDGYPKSDLDNLITQGAKIRLVVDHDTMSDYFNLSYSVENSYSGFSGLILVTQDNTVAGQIIVYNGTDFTVHGNNAT